MLCLSHRLPLHCFLRAILFSSLHFTCACAHPLAFTSLLFSSLFTSLLSSSSQLKFSYRGPVRLASALLVSDQLETTFISLRSVSLRSFQFRSVRFRRGALLHRTSYAYAYNYSFLLRRVALR